MGLNIELMTKLNNTYLNIIGLICLAYFPLTLSVPKASHLVLLVLIFASIWLVLNRKNWSFSKEDFLFTSSFVLYFIVISSITFYHGGEVREIDFVSRFLLIIPIYFFVKNSDFSKNWIFAGIGIAAIVFGLNWMLPSTFFDWTSIKGMQTFFSGLFSLLSLLQIKKTNKSWINLFFLMAFILGFISMIYSGGRGVWIAYILTFSSLVFFRFNFRVIKKFILLTFLVCSLLIAYSIPSTGVKQRVDISIENIHKYIENRGIEWRAVDSLIARFEMYKASYFIVEKDYLLGVGKNNYKQKVKDLVDDKKIHGIISIFNHPHNEFVSAIVFYGLPGLFVLLLIFGMALIYSFKDNRSDKALSNSLFALTVYYIFYAANNAVFAHQKSIILFVFLVSLLTGLINRAKKI